MRHYFILYLFGTQSPPTPCPITDCHCGVIAINSLRSRIRYGKHETRTTESTWQVQAQVNMVKHWMFQHCLPYSHVQTDFWGDVSLSNTQKACHNAAPVTIAIIHTTFLGVERSSLMLQLYSGCQLIVKKRELNMGIFSCCKQVYTSY